MERDKVIDKVRKLLALGQSDNAHEAAAAVARAHALMERYEIEEAMLGEESLEAEPVEDDVLRGGQATMVRWRSSLADVLARANGCRVYHTPAQRQLRVIGRRSDRETVRMLFDFCRVEINRLVNRECKGEGRAYRNSFRHGCVMAIREAVQQEKRRTRDEMLADAQRQGRAVDFQRALTVVDTDRAAAAQRYIDQHLKLRSSGSTTISNRSGLSHGRSAGANIYRSATQRTIRG